MTTPMTHSQIADLLERMRTLPFSDDARADIDRAIATLRAEPAKLQRSVAMCDHKFIDSGWCLKCGWRP